MFTEERSSSVKKSQRNDNESNDENSETVRLGGLRHALRQKKATPKVKENPVLAYTQEDSVKIYPDKLQALELSKEYSGIALKKNMRSLAAFLADPIMEVEDGHITYTVGSKTVAQSLLDEQERFKKMALTRSYTIERISCNVNAAKVSEYKIFTPKQQFEVMAKQNPLLKDLQARFDLDFED